MVPMRILVPCVLLVGLALARGPAHAEVSSYACSVEVTRISASREPVFTDKKAVQPGSSPKEVLYDGVLGTLTMGLSPYGVKVEWSKGPFKDRAGAYYKAGPIRTYAEDAEKGLGIDLICDPT